VVVVILAIILLAFIVHWAGGGLLTLRLGQTGRLVTCPSRTLTMIASMNTAA
jgi:hypothetical protein